MRVVEDEPGGVVVPLELAGLVAVLLGYGLDVFEARNGGLPALPGLRLLRAQLSAASGTRGRRVVPPVQPAVTYLTSGEAAKVMGLSARRVRELAADGVLRSRKSGRDWQIEADSAYDRRRRRWQEAA
ncbi:helix-turn-helix domain-containing protein [Streptomyces sp. TP-A0356]|uniref:helix-turn-helix domain-containing protein n=1 Tax=Streptomyces sp. TP-A0356 TaxID=1359208 RepID=UPI0006E3B2E0|nr:helix-turn-helix domain-containing protein [Streptomyces sp. TP-A0356]